MKKSVGLLLLAALLTWACAETSSKRHGPGRHLRHVRRLSGGRLFCLFR